MVGLLQRIFTLWISKNAWLWETICTESIRNATQRLTSCMQQRFSCSLPMKCDFQLPNWRLSSCFKKPWPKWTDLDRLFCYWCPQLAVKSESCLTTPSFPVFVAGEKFNPCQQNIGKICVLNVHTLKVGPSEQQMLTHLMTSKYMFNKIHVSWIPY